MNQRQKKKQAIRKLSEIIQAVELLEINPNEVLAFKYKAGVVSNDEINSICEWLDNWSYDNNVRSVIVMPDYIDVTKIRLPETAESGVHKIDTEE